MDTPIVLARFGAAIVLSFVLGVTRQRLGKPVGFGTFVFVALGSCGLSLTAIAIQPSNPLPLLAAIVTGIGFLGAGALMRTADRIVGFTSAASIWICAVFGLALGVGQYLIAGLVYASIWTVILVDGVMERRWLGHHQRKLTVDLKLGLSPREFEELELPPLALAQSIETRRVEGWLSLTYSIDRPRRELAEFVDRLSRHQAVLRLLVE